MKDEFWALRQSFLSPIPDVSLAADLLALAADNLLARNEIQARAHVEAANLPTLRNYTRSMISQTTREVHRIRDVANLPVEIPLAARGPRQPAPAVALNIYRRDGFRCRYCGCRIVSPLAQSVIAALLPDAVTWGTRDIELNAAFYTLKGVLDHVVPHAHGGTSEPDNLVVSCQPCNYGKGNYFLQQLGLSDPRLRPPIVDGWDGLLRVLPVKLARNKTGNEPVQIKPPADKAARAARQLSRQKRFASIDDFAASFSVAERRDLDSLLEFVQASGDLGASWTLNGVLRVQLSFRTITLDVLGVEPDSTVQVPWWIGLHKRAFRPFAETLAGALPSGTTYETEKMWRVHCFGRLPRISELMKDTEALRAAFEALHRALENSPG